jgi:predicted membrane channel-forming protein YqfA (hemolysin III family)
VATILIVAVARAADVAVAVQGERIPPAGFAELTLVGAVIGVVLAKSFARRAAEPRRTFVRVTVALTALSLVPDAIADASTGTKLVLMLTHVVAASIIIPRLAARLHR